MPSAHPARALRWPSRSSQQTFDPLIAGLFITFKEVYSVLQSMGAGPGVSVLILGSGSVGLNFVRAARALGAGPIIATGRREGRWRRRWPLARIRWST